MWYGSTKNLLESVVRGLKNEPPQNDAEWQAQADLVQGCLADVGADRQSVDGGHVTIRSPSGCG
jgi:hypothetical protein